MSVTTTPTKTPENRSISKKNFINNRFVPNGEKPLEKSKLKLVNIFVNNGKESAATSSVLASSATASGSSEEQGSRIERNRQETIMRQSERQLASNLISQKAAYELLTKLGTRKEQKARIERNRREAIERRIARNLKAAYERFPKNAQPVSLPSASLLSAQSELPRSQSRQTFELPGKSISPSKSMVSRERSNRYKECYKRCKRSNYRPSEELYKESVSCKIEFISEHRFVLRMNNHIKSIFNELSKLSSSSFSKFSIFDSEFRN